MNYKSQIKYSSGRLLSKLFPSKTRELNKNFTIPNYVWTSSESSSKVDRLIRFYLGKQAEEQEAKSPGKLEAIHKDFWENQNAFYEAAQNRVQEVYVPAYGEIIQALTEQLVERRIQTICEFGTGDGQWLNYLSQQFTTVDRFIGIDLAGQQIESNRIKYSNFEFYKADILDWVEQNVTPHTLYHTNSGVLEYLSEESVLRLFKVLNQSAKGSLLLLFEPLYEGFDIAQDTTSKIISTEYSYTHNYVHLMKLAGIRVMSYEERYLLGTRMLIVQGSID